MGMSPLHQAVLAHDKDHLFYLLDQLPAELPEASTLAETRIGMPLDSAAAAWAFGSSPVLGGSASSLGGLRTPSADGRTTALSPPSDEA